MVLLYLKNVHTHWNTENRKFCKKNLPRIWIYTTFSHGSSYQCPGEVTTVKANCKEHCPPSGPLVSLKLSECLSNPQGIQVAHLNLVGKEY